VSAEPESVVIRPGRRQDAKAIQALYESSVPKTTAGLAYEESDWRLYVGRPHVRLIVAEGRLDRGVVGMLLGYDLVNWGYCDVLVVSEKARKLGIGSRLLAAFECSGEDHWVASELAVDQEDEGLRAFVKKHGYAEAGTTEWRVRDLSTSGEAERRRRKFRGGV
jgi:ribosomal protein S18 acetylase RimI-like enzyme